MQPRVGLVAVVVLLCTAVLSAGCPSATSRGGDAVTPPPSASASGPPSASPTGTAPAASAAPSVDPAAVLTLRLAVGPGTELAIDGQPLDGLDALERHLAALAATRKVELVLVVGPGVTYERVVAIKEHARRAGVTAVAVEPAPRADPSPAPAGSMTVSSSPPPPGASGRPSLPTTSSGDADRVTPPIAVPTVGAPAPITPSPVPSAVP